MMNINEIKEILPHRYPMLLIDRVTEMDIEEKMFVKGYKNLSANEPFFQGKKHVYNKAKSPFVPLSASFAKAPKTSTRTPRPGQSHAAQNSKMRRLQNGKFKTATTRHKSNCTAPT